MTDYPFHAPLAFFLYDKFWLVPSIASVCAEDGALYADTVYTDPITLVPRQNYVELANLLKLRIENIEKNSPVSKKELLEKGKWFAVERAIGNLEKFLQESRMFSLTEWGKDFFSPCGYLEFPCYGTNWKTFPVWRVLFHVEELLKFCQFVSIEENFDELEVSLTPAVSLPRKNVGWLAVPSQDHERVTSCLGLEKLSSIGFADGISAIALQNWTFLTPPINGWIVIAGDTFHGQGTKSSLSRLEKIVSNASKSFGSAFGFSFQSTVGYYHWISGHAGKLSRSFCYLGESGQVLRNFGSLTEVEIRLVRESGSNTTSPAEWPISENWLQDIAASWSLDVFDVDTKTLLGAGLLCR